MAQQHRGKSRAIPWHSFAGKTRSFIVLCPFPPFLFSLTELFFFSSLKKVLFFFLRCLARVLFFFFFELYSLMYLITLLECLVPLLSSFGELQQCPFFFRFFLFLPSFLWPYELVVSFFLLLFSCAYANMQILFLACSRLCLVVDTKLLLKRLKKFKGHALAEYKLTLSFAAVLNELVPLFFFFLLLWRY